jgi:ferredoxin-NADP reductase/fatty acid desaturase
MGLDRLDASKLDALLVISPDAQIKSWRFIATERISMSFIFAPTTRQVLEQVVREPRFQALARIPLWAPLEIGLMLGAYAVFALGCWLYLGGFISWPVALLLNGAAIYAAFTPLHDATHRTVSSHRGLNDAIGTLSCGLLLPGVTTRIYRYLHLEHHRYTGDPLRDPDEPFVSAPMWRLPLVLTGLDVMWLWWYLRRWDTRPVGERVEFTVSITLYLAFHAVFLSSPWALDFVLLWMLPQRLGLFLLSTLFARIQHPHGVTWEAAPFQCTVRIDARPWTRWLLLGQALHCIHHFAPSLPFYRYHRAWGLGRHLLEAQQIPVRTIWSSVRDLPGLQRPPPLQPLRRQARISAITQVARDVKAFELEPDDGHPFEPATAGAHIDVVIRPGLVRPYSLCNPPGEMQRYLIAVRHDPQGRGGSAALHADLKPGDRLEIGTPRNHFPVAHTANEHLLIAGGIGITPLLAMAHELHARGARFVLHVCARDAGAMPFQETLRKAPFAGSVATWLDDAPAAGRFDAAAVIDAYRSGRALYVCGPAGFMAMVRERAREAGWPDSALHGESFGAPVADARLDTRFEVQLARSGRVLTVEPGQFLIDVLHANGCPVMCACTQGICGSCITPVLSGTPDHRDAILSEEARAANDRMTVCVSRSRSQRLVLDL